MATPARERPILLTGCNGQLGCVLRQTLAPLGTVLAFDRQSLDLADADALRRRVAECRPGVIVNAAAYTAVDKAETEADIAHAVNAVAPGVLGEAAAAIGALVVHYSTDYVFDGTAKGAYREEDAPNPLNVYGKSKLAGERALQASGAQHLIFRTSWVVGAQGGNFAKTILRLAAERETLNVVDDQYGAPTSAALLAETTARILRRYYRQTRKTQDFPCGLYHLTATGATSWHAYAALILAEAQKAGCALKLTAKGLTPIPSSAYPLPAARPANSRLDCTRLQHTFDLRLPPWQQGVTQTLQQIFEL
ncbi:MAG: dTDP-4-dehydrorhamnose reductase [Zoogloeaceae bacterium]|jgi:dTDP-4-dehydrorhamnose reductase|nr:dTDP-4-dehydrorhamnose reductase [Zoogloeaceae bacterium]